MTRIRRGRAMKRRAGSIADLGTSGVAALREFIEAWTWSPGSTAGSGRSRSAIVVRRPSCWSRGPVSAARCRCAGRLGSSGHRRGTVELSAVRCLRPRLRRVWPAGSVLSTLVGVETGAADLAIRSSNCFRLHARWRCSAKVNSLSARDACTVRRRRIAVCRALWRRGFCRRRRGRG